MSLIKPIRHWRQSFGLPIRTEPAIPSDEESTLAMNLIEEESDELLAAMENKDMREIADGLADMLFVIVQAADVYGLDIEKVTSIVYRSNMSKLCDGEKIRDATLEKYTKEGIEVYYKETAPGKYIVLRSKDDKVLKATTFTVPDWSSIGL